MNNIQKSAVLLLLPLAAWAAPTATQTLTLKPGWNVVYAEVAPEGSVDGIFSSWPTDSVGLYEPSKLLATAQFSAEDETLGLVDPPFATWKRGYPELSDALRLAAGTVLVFFGTNAQNEVTTLEGVPAAPRIKWHASGTNDLYNYVGFSLQEGAKVLPRDYLDGFGGEPVANRTLYRVFGTSKDAPPQLVKISGTTKVSDGEVLAMPSSIVSGWSGTLFVSPATGLDYGAEEVLQSLSIRNDGAAARTVRIELAVPSNADEMDVALPWTSLHFRDADRIATDASWTNSIGAFVGARLLAAGETWNLQVGLDRRTLENEVYGKSFGAILRITDADGVSKMRVEVPLQGVTSGGTAAATAWPGGLWVADVALDKVKAPGESAATEAGGTLKLRLPLHIGSDGRIRLLQRVVAAGETDADGHWDYRLYGGAATPPPTARSFLRISAVCLPTETPVVEAAAGSTLASGKAQFRFTVAGDGATSLLRHPLHPQHDGLRWDFKTPAPSGDDWANYKYDVKPETFSVESAISLTLDFDGGQAAWNPERSVTGTCEWSLSGLRHEGPVVVSGPMSLTRVSPKAEIVLE